MLWNVSKNVCLVAMAIAVIAGLAWMKFEPSSTTAQVLSWITRGLFILVGVILAAFVFDWIFGAHKWRALYKLTWFSVSIGLLAFASSNIKGIYEVPLEIRTDYWQNGGGVMWFWLNAGIAFVGLFGLSKMLTNFLFVKKKPYDINPHKWDDRQQPTEF